MAASLTSLHSLPSEIINCIVSCLGSCPDRYNLARCSRRFHTLTIPYLYRNVTVKEEDWGGRWPIAGPLRGLASLLLRRPDLADRVKEFTLLVADYNLEPAECEVDETLRTAVSASGYSENDQAIMLTRLGDARSCCHDVILALLLPVLIKVETVVLQYPVKFNTTFMEQTIRTAARRERPFDIQPPFQALQAFVFPNTMQDELRTGLVASLLKLPKIRQISGGCISRLPGADREPGTWNQYHSEEGVSDQFLTELSSSSSSLTDLELAATEPKAAELAHILRAPRALNSFFYQIDPSSYIDFQDIHRFLRPQERHLKSLGLEYCLDNFDEPIDLPLGHPNYLGPMPSFANLTALKVFKTPTTFLEWTEMGPRGRNLLDMFPISLTTLHLTRLEDVSDSILDALEHLLANKSSSQIPSLEILILEEGVGSFGMRPAKNLQTWHESGLTIDITGQPGLPEIAAAHGVSIYFIDDIHDHKVRAWETDE
ncbi:hypothetical protein MMC07_004512 [Pseudocyphellaria aurata]|nr:hypothetical protein [Pseudocyphellaria aurata]